MKHTDQDHLWMMAGRKKLTHLLEADGNQEVFDFTPFPFGMREACNLIQVRWFFEGHESIIFSGFLLS